MCLLTIKYENSITFVLDLTEYGPPKINSTNNIHKVIFFSALPIGVQNHNMIYEIKF